jgi:Na+/melibiose symporter-like transporter
VTEAGPRSHTIHFVKILGVLIVVGLAFAAVFLSMGLLVPRCGENQEDACSLTSSPMLAVALAWIGLIGVGICLLMARFGYRTAMMASVVLTVLIYGCWLIFIVQDTGA